MPTDNRRLPVPAETTHPHSLSLQQEPKKLVSEDGKRQDGRLPGQTRPIFVKAGVVSQAKGSAYMEMNQTKLICAVYGPREVVKREEFSMTGQLLCEFRFATFAKVKRGQHQQSNLEKEYSKVIQEAMEPAVCLEKFPKARMDIFVTVLQDDGACLAAAITCASVALADAKVEMYDLVIGCSLRHFDDTDLLDPTSEEQYSPMEKEVTHNSGSVTVGLMPSLHQVSALMQKGELDCSAVQEGIKICVEACQRTYPVIQQCLVRAVKSKLQQNKR